MEKKKKIRKPTATETAESRRVFRGLHARFRRLIRAPGPITAIFSYSACTVAAPAPPPQPPPRPHLDRPATRYFSRNRLIYVRPQPSTPSRAREGRAAGRDGGRVLPIAKVVVVAMINTAGSNSQANTINKAERSFSVSRTRDWPIWVRTPPPNCK